MRWVRHVARMWEKEMHVVFLRETLKKKENL
jgi:hypothetical protein